MAAKPGPHCRALHRTASRWMLEHHV